MVEATGRILVAQSPERMRVSVADLLRRANFGVSEATTAAEAMRLAVDLPDLLVLDSGLPDCLASVVLRRLRDDPVTAALPVLLIDSVGGGEGGEWDGYLTADAEPAEILAWVRALVRRLDAPRMESLGRIASGVGHDLNNLLTIILSHGELLGEMLPAGSSGRCLLTGIESAARTAAEMVAQLLALARQQPIPPQSLDLNQAIFDLVGLLQRVFDARIQFTVEASPMPPIRAVPSQITQVLLNLCLNARDAMPQGGLLTLRTEWVMIGVDTFVRLTVSDTGGGIPAELLPRIFDPFFTTRPGVGTGLGLAMVQQLVRLHKGWVECKSELGRGSRFEVYLPLRAANETV